MGKKRRRKAKLKRAQKKSRRPKNASKAPSTALKRHAEEIRSRVVPRLQRLDAVALITQCAAIKQVISFLPFHPLLAALEELPLVSFCAAVRLSSRHLSGSQPTPIQIVSILDDIYAFHLNSMFALHTEPSESASPRRSAATLEFRSSMIRLLRATCPGNYSFQVHRHMVDLYSKFDEELVGILGVSAEEALSLASGMVVWQRSCAEQLALRCGLTPARHAEKNSQESHEQLAAFVSPVVQEAKSHLLVEPEKILSEVPNRVGGEKRFLEVISCAASDFVEEPWSLTSPNPLYDRPLLRLGEKYLVLGSEVLGLRLPNELSVQLLSNQGASRRFQRARANYVEDRVFKALRHVFGDDVSRNLYYLDEAGSRQETDVLVVHDDTLIVVEARSGGFSTGGPERIRRDLKALVDKPFRQGLRTASFVSGSDALATFTDKRGKFVLEVDPSRLKRVLLVTVSLENLYGVSASPAPLQAVGLLDGALPWAVCLDELEMVVNWLHTPAVFVHFLSQRVRANEDARFFAFDELSFLGYYLQFQSFYPALAEDTGAPYDLIGIGTDFAEPFDNHFLRGEAPPQLDLDPLFGIFLFEVICTPAVRGYISVAVALLDIGRAKQTEFVATLNHLIQLTRADHQVHDVSFSLGPPAGIGFTIVTGWNVHEPDLRVPLLVNSHWNRQELGRWVALQIDVSDEGIRLVRSAVVSTDDAELRFDDSARRA